MRRKLHSRKRQRSCAKSSCSRRRKPMRASRLLRQRARRRSPLAVKGRGCQPMRAKALINRQSLISNPAKRCRQGDRRLRLGRCETSRGMDRVVPMAAPQTIETLRPPRPRQHRRAKIELKGSAQPCQRFGGSLENVLRIDDRRRAAELLGDEIEQLPLLDNADGTQRDIFPFSRIAREHRDWIANEERVEELQHPPAIEARKHMVGHVLLVEYGLG